MRYIPGMVEGWTLARLCVGCEPDFFCDARILNEHYIMGVGGWLAIPWISVSVALF
jgi:hypothetical protein